MKKKIQLLTLSVERGSLSVLTNDVHVDYEYEDFKGNEVELFLNVFIGDDEDHYRFRLKLCYHVFLDEEYESETRKVENIILLVADSLMDIIVTIDNILKNEGE